MRRKIREIMNKEEGFTLVELLAVLAILAIIVAIAIPAIGNVVGKSKDSATEAEKELVVDAARLYDIENNIEGEITVDKLITAGYLDLRGSEGKKDSNIKEEDKVIVKRTESGGTTYKFVPKDN